MSVESPALTASLLPRVLKALRQAGYDPDNLDPEALVRFEHLHTLGHLGSATLARATAISAADHVLDAGCGIGGPARFLAGTFGCRVTGIDNTPDFLFVASNLNDRVRLQERIGVCGADVLLLPFADATFDVVWTQHVAMNMPDKARLYEEFRRVVRPGGRLALFDVVAGDDQGTVVYLPVPWATEESQNHLVPSATILSLVEAAGFRVTVVEDPTPVVLDLRDRSDDGGDDSSPLGLHLILGDTVELRLANTERNFSEGRIRLLRCVAVAC